jgi:hypothetical protein
MEYDVVNIITLVVHLHVKIVFLKGDLKEEVHMTSLEGYVIPRREIKVCHLVKTLCGLC